MTLPRQEPQNLFRTFAERATAALLREAEEADALVTGKGHLARLVPILAAEGDWVSRRPHAMLKKLDMPAGVVTAANEPHEPDLALKAWRGMVSGFSMNCLPSQLPAPLTGLHQSASYIYAVISSKRCFIAAGREVSR